MTDTLIMKDKFTREKLNKFIKVLCDIGTFRNEDPNIQGNSTFMVRFNEE